MSRRSLATLTLTAGLLLLAGCLQLDGPVLPRLRSLLPGSNGSCAPGMVCDIEGPIMDVGEQVGSIPATSKAPLPEGVMPQPRLVPQPSATPEAQPTPYVPTKR